jgi:hypothetical protein
VGQETRWALGAELLDRGLDATGSPRVTERRRGPRPSGRRLIVVALALVVVVVIALVGLRPYVPLGDHALLELGVRRGLGGHPPEVGPFSRFGWYHPGPAIYYVLMPGYAVTGGASWSLPVTTLLINVGCLVGIVALVRRQLGTATAAWAALVCLFYLRQLPAGLLRDPWNPYLALLPFFLGVLLCWAAVNGTRWALPAALVLFSFAVQSHVGYAVAVAAALLSAVVLMIARRPWPSGRSSGAAAVALVLMWLPPALQQLFGHPGNVAALVRDFSRPAPHPDLTVAVRMVGTELARVPAYLTGRTGEPQFLAPDVLPAPLAWIAVACFALTVVLVIRRRDRELLTMVPFVVVLAGAAVVAVMHTRGLLFPYLVEWDCVPGLLLWLVVGSAVIRFLEPRLKQTGLAVALAAACLPVAALFLVDLVSTKPESTPGLTRVARDIAGWQRQAGAQSGVVQLQYLSTLRPTLVGVTGAGAGLMLQLDRQGIPFVPPPGTDLGLAPVVKRVTRAPAAELFVGLDTNSPPPPNGYRQIARDAGLVIYAGPAQPQP